MTPRELLAAARDAIALGVFVGFILLVTPSRGHAALLSQAALDANADAAIAVLIAFLGVCIGYGMAWLQYAPRGKVVAPHDAERDGEFDYRRMGQ